MTSSMKYALVAVSFALFFSLALNSYQFTTLSITKNDLQSQVTDLASQVSRLQEQLNATENLVSALQEENRDLKDLLNARNAPNLVTSLGVTDVHLPPMMGGVPTNYRLFIEGTVYNVGSRTAYNSRLHVILYRGGSIVVDTRVSLGTIYGGSSVPVSSNIPYSGDALTDWDIVPEFDLK